MARQPRTDRPAAHERNTEIVDSDARGAALNSSDASVAGVAGPGKWLVATYLPTALFSLKSSQATSSVGKTLVVPTMYAIKLAVVDAGFRAGLAESACADLLRALAPIDVRIGPPEGAVVTHTFVKVRQEPKKSNILRPYLDSIAYREVVHHTGVWRWAFNLAHGTDQLAEWLVQLLPIINSIGKRGSFIQFISIERKTALSTCYTVPRPEPGFLQPDAWHLALLDDFGPDATLAVLSSYTSVKPRPERHRLFVPTVVPVGLVNTGFGFTEYRAGGLGQSGPLTNGNTRTGEVAPNQGAPPNRQ